MAIFPQNSILQYARSYLINNVDEKIRRVWLTENECILMLHEGKVVTRVQITNRTRAHCQNLRLSWLCDFFFMYIINK